MTQPIQFYDLANRLGLDKSMSMNTLKTRFTLTYKRIPFETVWVRWTDIPRVSGELGIPPAADGRYTLPAIHDPTTGARLADSFAIAQYLDERFPERPVVGPPGTEAKQRAFADAVFETIGVDAALVGFAGASQMMDEEDKAVFDARFTGRGIAIDAIWRMPAEEKRTRVAAGLSRLAAAIDAQSGQNGHVVGDSISFADLAAAAFVEFFRLTTDEAEYILTLDGGRWKRLLDEIQL